jgi:hypothetical protein
MDFQSMEKYLIVKEGLNEGCSRPACTIDLPLKGADRIKAVDSTNTVCIESTQNIKRIIGKEAAPVKDRGG